MIEEDMNPYDLPDDDPALKLRITTRAPRNWIYANWTDPAMKGLQLYQYINNICVTFLSDFLGSKGVLYPPRKHT